jgi:hypothetical protein
MSGPLIENRTAEDIDHALMEDHHKLWGFVIYRCTYKDDEKWKSFMDRFHKEIEKSMYGPEGQAVLKKLVITVLEDPSWEDASTATIRAHFHDWCDQNAEREQGVPFPSNRRYWKGWRYNFCVHMDSYALESFDEDADPKDFVNIILSPWVSIRDEPPPVEKRPKPSWWKGTWPPPPEEYDELEGNTEEDVGWMMVELNSLVAMYTRLRRWDTWHTEYRRPPIVATDGVSYQSHKR